jgi:RNA polymerase sigma-70 factor (ECF subfamily)
MTRHQEQVTRLYEEARDDVYRYLITLGLAPGQAQEAAQEVFLRLYMTLQKGESIQNPRGWVFRVAHNLGLDWRAKERAVPLEPEAEAALRDPARSVESDLLEKERMTQISEAWQGLSPQQKQCLHLRAEGLRYREIAESLGISISSVREFLGRAVSRLQRAL